MLNRPFAIALVAATALFAAEMATAGGRNESAFTDIQKQLTAINAQLNELGAMSDLLAQAAKKNDSYVPFKVQVPGGLCDSAVAPSSNPHILIDSDGVDPFVVTSVLIKRGFMNPVDFLFLSVNGVKIDGTNFDTRTRDLFGPLGGEFAVEQSADIVGMPVRQSGLHTSEPGGNVPHQIVAEGDGASDIDIEMFCRSDNQDMNIETVLVAGWKKPGDTVSVRYVPGH